MSGTGRPLWRQGFDALERTLTPRLSDLLGTDEFGSALDLATRTRRGVQRQAERTTRKALHVLNLPAGSDITRLLVEIGRLQTETRRLAREVEQLNEGDGDAAATSRSRGARHPDPA